MWQEFGSDPHVSELGHQKAEAFTRKVELTTTLAFLFKKYRTVHVDQNYQQAKRKVWNGFIDTVDFFDLIIKELEDFLGGKAFSCELVNWLFGPSYWKRAHFKSVLHSHHQLNLVLKIKTHLKSFACTWTNLDLKVKLLKSFKVILQIGIKSDFLSILSASALLKVIEGFASETSLETAEKTSHFLKTALIWPRSALVRQILFAQACLTGQRRGHLVLHADGVKLLAVAENFSILFICCWN